jgi:hypothetical protein
MFSFEDTVTKLQNLDVFVSKKAFKESEIKTHAEI